MSVSNADIAFARDLFAPLGDLTKRKMFGGLGIYHAGNIFALVSSQGRIYIKTNAETATALAEEGAEQFHNMPYWSLPDHTLDDPETACHWARKFLN